MQDVHLGGSREDFTCQTCHPASGHRPRPAGGSAAASWNTGCSSCHQKADHAPASLNRHLAVLSCQTCHIPQYGRQQPILLGWNWLMTGKTSRVFQSFLETRRPIHDRNGLWAAAAVEPAYLWDNGADMVYTRGQRIMPRELTFLQSPVERSPDSKVAPFRVVYGTQLYDAKYRYLISPLLSASGEAYFPESDWNAVARQGMEAIVLPYSGFYGFAPTAVYRRINHEVLPAAQALGCMDCHGSRGRIKWQDLGYDRDPWSEKTGGTAAPESAPPPEPAGTGQEGQLPSANTKLPVPPTF
jgi:hypothetical protein